MQLEIELVLGDYEFFSEHRVVSLPGGSENHVACFLGYCSCIQHLQPLRSCDY